MFRISTPKIVNRFTKAQDGATAVEFGMVAFPFFFLMVAILEASLHFFAGQLLESAVDNAARQLRTGQFEQTHKNDVSAAQAAGDETTPDEVATFVKLLKANSSGFLDPDKFNINVEFANDFNGLNGPPPLTAEGTVDTDAYNFTVPGGSQIAMVTVTYEWPVFTNYMQAAMSDLSNNKALLTAIAIFKTEGF